MNQGLLQNKKEETEILDKIIITCPRIIGITFSTVICICILWLIIKY